jgi:hypothetical protein
MAFFMAHGCAKLTMTSRSAKINPICPNPYQDQRPIALNKLTA